MERLSANETNVGTSKHARQVQIRDPNQSAPAHAWIARQASPPSTPPSARPTEGANGECPSNHMDARGGAIPYAPDLAKRASIPNSVHEGGGDACCGCGNDCRSMRTWRIVDCGLLFLLHRANVRQVGISVAENHGHPTRPQSVLDMVCSSVVVPQQLSEQQLSVRQLAQQDNSQDPPPFVGAGGPGPCRATPPARPSLPAPVPRVSSRRCTHSSRGE